MARRTQAAVRRLVEEAGRPMSVAELAFALGVGRDGIPHVESIVDRLIEKGKFLPCNS